MRLQVLTFSICVWLASTTIGWSLPHRDGVLVVGSREFFVGTSDMPDDSSEMDWPFDYSNWLGRFIDKDRTLSDYSIFFHQTGIPANELVKRTGRVGGDTVTLDTDLSYQVDHLYTFSRPGEYVFFPKDEELIFAARCIGDPHLGFNICNIRVAYPYDENVSLVAKRFLPGTLSEIGETFEEIAHRMVDIAICLDVTGVGLSTRSIDLNDILSERQWLQECEISLVS